jgi:hypothetical protein
MNDTGPPLAASGLHSGVGGWSRGSAALGHGNSPGGLLGLDKGAFYAAVR